MRSIPLLIEAEPLSGYTGRVRFEDGTGGDIDLSYLADLGGVFEPLRDPATSASSGPTRRRATIVWPNRADIAPETLYAHVQQSAAATA